MGGEVNYYPFHIGDYAAHTQRLSLMEDLAYRRMLDAYYLAERPFTGTAADVAREIGMTEHVASVEYVLSKFFTCTESGHTHKRCDKEIAKFADKKEKASRAGLTSVERRLNVRSTSVEKKPTSVKKKSTDVQLTKNQEPRTNNQSNTSSDEASPSPGAQAFNAYAQAYRTRYGCDPVRDVKVNSLFANIAKRLGANAPAVAAWYVTSESLLPYTKSSHDPTLLLRDAAGLHTRWLQGSPMSTKTAIAADDAVGDMDMVRRVAARFGEVSTPMLTGAKPLAIEERAPLI
jgi:uncharacterized protein YdaU (DUF1376 family)